MLQDWSERSSDPATGDILHVKNKEWDTCEECYAYYAYYPENGEYYLIYDYECTEMKEDLGFDGTWV